MDIGPINTAMPAAAAAGSGNASNINAAQPSGDAKNGNSGIEQNNVNIPGKEKETAAGAPQPIKQMSTSDFLNLKEATQGENVMDKLEKIFETILALKLLDETLENTRESREEQAIQGEK
jgi:hypothetical protein